MRVTNDAPKKERKKGNCVTMQVNGDTLGKKNAAEVKFISIIGQLIIYSFSS